MSHSAGSEPPDQATARSPARWVNQPSAICERPALWTQRNSTMGFPSSPCPSTMAIARRSRAVLEVSRGLTDTFHLLTAREREVLQLLAEGRSNKDVATLLQVGLSTVETHRANLMQKLNLHNTAEIVLYAVRKGIIR